MRWVITGSFVLLAACHATAPAPSVRAPPRAEAVPIETSVPDVTAPLPSDGIGSRDAALIIGIDHYPALPGVPLASHAARDWGTFLVRNFGVPGERVTLLLNEGATRRAILGDVSSQARRVELGGRLYVVFIGHGGKNLVPFDGGDAREEQRLVAYSDLKQATDASPAQPVLVFDVGHDAPLLSRLGAHTYRGTVYSSTETRLPTSRDPIVFESAWSGELPGSHYPVFSYLLLDALRGWADDDHDGRVTATEAIAYVSREQHRLHFGRPGSVPDLTSEIECKALTTLSAATEPAPDLSRWAVALESTKDVHAGEDAMRAEIARADSALRDAYTTHAAAGGTRGIPERLAPDVASSRDGNHWEVTPTPMPAEVRRAVDARVRFAELSGPRDAEAAHALVEAARLSFRYGDLGAARRLAEPVMNLRCGFDMDGFEAWSLALESARYSEDSAAAFDLGHLDCTFDDESRRRLAASRPILQSIPYSTSQRRYEEGLHVGDPRLVRCYLEEAALGYEAEFRKTPGSRLAVAAAEAVLNGADAFQRVGLPDRAAALYSEYVRAQAHGVPGDSPGWSETRHRYTVMACQLFEELAGYHARLRPAYADVCTHQDFRSCAEGDPADCAHPGKLKTGNPPPSEPERLAFAADDARELAEWETEIARLDRAGAAKEPERTSAAYDELAAHLVETLDYRNAALLLARESAQADLPLSVRQQAARRANDYLAARGVRKEYRVPVP